MFPCQLPLLFSRLQRKFWLPYQYGLGKCHMFPWFRNPLKTDPVTWQAWETGMSKISTTPATDPSRAFVSGVAQITTMRAGPHNRKIWIGLFLKGHRTWPS
jgi:hypothetical protein